MISVVIPCFNAAAFVGRAIESVFIQDHEDWEIILVDNNSTDDTLDVLLGYEKAHPGKISVLQERKKGGAAARNCGLNHAKGEWIQFLDADDMLLPQKFSRQLELAAVNKANIIAGSFARVVAIKGFEFKFEKKVNDQDVWQALITAKLGITSANFFFKENVLAVKGWDESLTSSQEYDLMFRLLVSGAKVACDKTVSALIYYEGNSITRGGNLSKNIQVSENYLGLRARILKHLESSNMLTNARKQLIDVYRYAYLKDKVHITPQYANDKLTELALVIPVKYKIKIKLRTIGKSILSKLKNR